MFSYNEHVLTDVSFQVPLWTCWGFQLLIQNLHYCTRE